MKKRKNKNFKLSKIFFGIAGFLVLFLILSFLFGVHPSSLNVNVGGDKGVTIGATGISDITLIIILSIIVVAFLTGLIIKLKFEKSK